MIIPRRIVLLGFMASGKSSVARALTQLLKCTMADLDQLICEDSGRSIAQIIHQDGESAFRVQEALMLKNLVKARSMNVIALGGGTWAFEENRKLIQREGAHTIWLDAPFELCWERLTRHGEHSRPLAANYSIARRLFAERRPLYALADIRVSVSRKTNVEMLASEIVRRCSQRQLLGVR